MYKSFHCCDAEPKSNVLSVFGIIFELTSPASTTLSSAPEPSVIVPDEPPSKVISPTACILPVANMLEAVISPDAEIDVAVAAPSIFNVEDTVKLPVIA